MPAMLTRTPGKAVFLLAAVFAIWFVPYHFAVQPSISLSYVVGYNNRVALLLFLAGALLFAGLTQGKLALETDARNQDARPRDLWLGIVVVLLVCLLRHHHAGPPKSESAYMINRLQMLAAGVRPYTGFEFVYGPLQLYVPLAISRMFRCSVVQGFYVAWFAQWLLGVGVLWTTVRLLPLCLRRRRLLFWAALAMELPNILNEGAAYTPLRMVGPACCVLLLCAAWHRRRQAWVQWGLASGITALELGLFPEQGIAFAAGLVAWLGLRAYRLKTLAAFGLVAGYMTSCALLFLLCAHFGEFKALTQFAGGAYSLPLVPSVPVALILFAYLAGVCCAMQAWRADRTDRTDRLDGPEIPLALCGLAALPAAFGRCDLGHLQLASPLLFLGVASIESWPAVRKVWSPLTLAFLLLSTYGFVIWLLAPKLLHRPSAGTVAAVRAESLARAAALAPPCAVVYRMPVAWPDYDKQPGGMCLATGYYAGLLDVLTPAAIARKEAEITAEPRRPLLMAAGPPRLGVGLEPLENQVGVLRVLEQALYLPPPRNAPLTYEPLIRTIEENYTPAGLLGNEYRVWEPKIAGRIEADRSALPSSPADGR